MSLFGGIATSASGLSAQQLRLDVISNNLANASTTRTADGGPFQRSRVIFRPIVNQPYWRSPFLPESLDNGIGKGVRVNKVEKDNSPARLVYDPTHPDAIKTGPKQGYVEMPNVNVVNEMVDMIDASRAYEANVTLINGAKAMFSKALEIGR
jgi:flagellar basal-body rod protein FlgC